MDDVSTDGQQAPGEPGSARRGLVWAVLVTAVAVGVFVLVIAERGWTSYAWQAALTLSGVSLGALGTAGAVVGTWRQTRAEAHRISAGRERVREAEQGLERALRPSSPFNAETVVVHGDLVFPKPGEGQAIGGRELGAVGPRPQTTGAETIIGVAGPVDSSARLTLPELWTVTHRRLDLYHEIALGQASRSFRNAQYAMLLGFGLLVLFVVVALRAGTTAESVVVGGLGVVAAGLAGYVSRTFVRSQEAAAGHLRAYFDQPLEFSRYLAAERLVADAGLSDERRAEVMSVLIDGIVAGREQGRFDGSGSSGGASS